MIYIKIKYTMKMICKILIWEQIQPRTRRRVICSLYGALKVYSGFNQEFLRVGISCLNTVSRFTERVLPQLLVVLHYWARYRLPYIDERQSPRNCRLWMMLVVRLD